MGSLLGTTLVKVFLFHSEKIWLENCSLQFIAHLSLNLLCTENMWTSHIYFFVQQNMHKNFKSILRSNTQTISFTFEIEEYGLLSFLDIKISKLITSVYWRAQFTIAFTNFERFSSKSYIVYFILYYIENLVYTQIWKSFIRKLILWSQS